MIVIVLLYFLYVIVYYCTCSVAVTLIAFGSAAPEILLNSVSAVKKTSDLSLPAILGSAIIAFGLIPAMSILLNTKNEMMLLPLPIVREVCLS